MSKEFNFTISGRAIFTGELLCKYLSAHAHTTNLKGASTGNILSKRLLDAEIPIGTTSSAK